MKRRRKQLLVDPVVQWTLFRRVICHWLYFLVLTALVLPFWMAVVCGDIFAGTSFDLREIIAMSWVRSLPVLILLVVTAPLFAWDVLKLSHRFVGPIYQLHKAIKGLAAGENIQPVRLRPNDFWKQVIGDFNVLAERVTSMRRQETPTTKLLAEPGETRDAESANEGVAASQTI